MRPTTFPRLVVADNVGVRIWDNADSITTDALQDATLTGMAGNATAVAYADDRLFVTGSDSTDSLFRFDNASSLTTGATPTATVPTTAFNGTPQSVVYKLEVDRADRLWITGGAGEIRLFSGASSLGASSTSQAAFTHPFGQIFNHAYDPMGDTLFGGQVSGPGVLGFDSPLTASGEGVTHDWTLIDTLTPSWLEVRSDKLFVASFNDPPLRIWNGISALSTTTAPDVVMARDTAALSSVNHLHLRGNTMTATNNDAVNGYRVLIYDDATALTASSAPNSTVTHADLVLPKKSILDANDNLYVLMSGSVLIFENATTAPSLKVKLDAYVDGATDMALMQ